MNLEFTGAARICWMLGIGLILISALMSVFTGANTGAPLVLIGAVLVGAAFLLRKRGNRG